ncbi:hypothetical protein Poly41_17480 [Novipirellula artificiosorum]|uniref:Uncharacterized protein n=1 Tax=Novipirellula artificiosorum TaxID=2528016 RepID=A0A5C6DU64_9BACT|nr:hypothetical protein Poly41_17480 [Novipirellula artificiosorum]
MASGSDSLRRGFQLHMILQPRKVVVFLQTKNFRFLSEKLASPAWSPDESMGVWRPIERINNSKVVVGL